MTAWRKSSYSMSNGDCVEVVPSGGLVLVRDSKNPRPVLAFSTEQWDEFLGELRREMGSMGPKEGGSGAHEGGSKDGKGGKDGYIGKHEAGGKGGQGGGGKGGK